MLVYFLPIQFGNCAKGGHDGIVVLPTSPWVSLAQSKSVPVIRNSSLPASVKTAKNYGALMCLHWLCHPPSWTISAYTPAVTKPSLQASNVVNGILGDMFDGQQGAGLVSCGMKGVVWLVVECKKLC